MCPTVRLEKKIVTFGLPEHSRSNQSIYMVSMNYHRLLLLLIAKKQGNDLLYKNAQYIGERPSLALTTCEKIFLSLQCIISKFQKKLSIKEIQIDLHALTS